MFTRDELIAELPRLAAVDAPPLEVARFNCQDFDSFDSEQRIWAFRGFKRDFSSALLFWIKTLQSQDWEGRQQHFGPYAGAGLCEPITMDEFAKLVADYSDMLLQPLPPFLTELARFRTGLRMYAEWNDTAAVAELPTMYVAFYWSTTA